MRWITPSTVAALLLALAREAGAQAPEPASAASVMLMLELRYTLGAGADRCPAEEGLHQEVARRMGYDPFVRGASDAGEIDAGRVTASIAAAPKGLVATYEYMNPDGTVAWAKIYPVSGTSRSSCDVAISGMAVDLAVELVLRKPPLTQPPPPPPRGPACSESKPLPAAEPLPCPESPYSVWPREPPMLGPPPDPPKPPERWPVAVRLGAAVWPELIATSLGSLGFSTEVGARYKAISANVEAHGDPPLGSVTYPGGTAVSFARVSGALLLCAHYGWFAGCGVGDMGRFIFPDHAKKLPASTFYGAAGARAQLEFPVAPPRLFLRVGLDLRAPIHPASYTFGATTVFQAVGLGVGFGLGFVAELPP